MVQFERKIIISLEIFRMWASLWVTKSSLFCTSNAYSFLMNEICPQNSIYSFKYAPMLFRTENRVNQWVQRARRHCTIEHSEWFTINWFASKIFPFFFNGTHISRHSRIFLFRGLVSSKMSIKFIEALISSQGKKYYWSDSKHFIVCKCYKFSICIFLLPFFSLPPQLSFFCFWSIGRLVDSDDDEWGKLALAPI